MPRDAYLALCGPADDPRLAERAAELDALPDWRRRFGRGSLRVWTSPDDTLPVSPLGRDGLILGPHFPMPGAAPGPPPAFALDGDDRLADWLARHRWGGYAALLCDGRGEVAVYRDPSGDLDVLTWALGAGHVIASELRRIPGALRPRRHGLRWDRIARYMAIPAAHTTEALFEDVAAVGPGERRALDAAATRPVWRPADHLAPIGADRREAQGELVRRIDAAAAALVGRHDRIVAEVSGGLDSAIVASAIAAGGLAPRVAHWVNRAVARAEGDERAYARAVTDRLGVPLTVSLKTPDPLIEADLAELADATWPAMLGIETGRDREDAARLVAAGATAQVSGQGGDALFFQAAVPQIVADAWARGGWRTLGAPLLAEVARRTRQSVWRVLASARASRGRPPPMPPSPLVSADAAALAAGALHAWTRDAFGTGAPPAKVFQVMGLANHHIFHGDSRRRRQADILYPLLAQPVLEFVLGLPVPELVAGGEDRPFAREAFADRLPDLVRERRSKGGQGAHFARLVAASLPMLRPFLLDGCLAKAGVLDRRVLEASLTAEHLIWHGRGPDILWAAATEAWVRHWQAQVPDARSAWPPR